jgi:hypothetical protein
VYAGENNVNNVQKSVNRAEGRYLVCPCLHPSGIRLDRDAMRRPDEKRLMRRKELLCCAQQTRTPHRGASLPGINYLRYEIKFTLVTFMKLTRASVKVVDARAFFYCANFFQY